MELYPIDLFPLPPIDTPEEPHDVITIEPEAEEFKEQDKGTVIDEYA